MRHLVTGFAALSAFALSVPAIAQQKPPQINVAANNPFNHQPTGVKLPPAVAGIPRDGVKAFAPDELDVAGIYVGADGNDVITIYLFRNVSAAVPVWFDRAAQVISLLPDKYPDLKRSGIRPFTPRGQKVASGLMEAMATSGPFRSTGLMVLPVNGFYAKIRISSRNRDAAGLEQLMLAVANDIDWSSKRQEAVAAPIANCATPLAVQAEAKISEDRMNDAVMGSLANLIGNVKPEGDTKPSIWCRQAGQPLINYGVYRVEGSNDAYILALIDSGRAISVGWDGISTILNKSQPGTVTVNHVDLAETTTFQSFSGLPSIDRLIEHVEKSAPVARSVTWGKEAGKKVDVFTN